uniref:Uncharacterized protein MANES_01G237500 n=1 Tax=Rhizophora mucronata TaxID=61149 RepID=A0A2P2LDA1_RHIMU
MVRVPAVPFGHAEQAYRIVWEIEVRGLEFTLSLPTLLVLLLLCFQFVLLKFAACGFL